MTLSTFPYLTPALLESDGVYLLSQLVALVPKQYQPYVQLAQMAVSIMQKAPIAVQVIGHVEQQLQHICDTVNSITGAQPAAVTG